MPSSIARLRVASILCRVPALTAPVKPRSQQQLGVLGGDQGEHRRRILHVDIFEPFGVGVGDVIVALDHPGHQRAAGEIVDHVVGARFGRVAVGSYCANAIVFDYDGRVFFGALRPSIKFARRKKIRPIEVIPRVLRVLQIRCAP